MAEPPEPSIQLLAEAAQNESTASKNGLQASSDHDDRSSSLSDLEDRPGTEGTGTLNNKSSPVSEEEDTEAETERLETSPQKARKQRNVVLSATRELSNGSSMVHVASLDAHSTEGRGNDNHRKANSDSVSDAMDPTSDISSLGDSAEGSAPDSPTSTSSKKRKREEDSTAQSLKKVAIQLANKVADRVEKAEQDTGSLLGASENGEHRLGGGNVSEVDGEQSTPGDQQDHGAHIELREGGDADSDGEDIDMEDAGPEPETGSLARTEEEVRRKKAALESLATIEKDFALLRDKLFTERTKQLNEELATLEGPAITHPEYLSMVEAIANQRRERVELAKTGYRFKVKALQVKSVAERTQHHSQYMQSVREIRDLALERANKEWYQIQRERRTFDEDGLSGMFPCAAKRSELVAQQNAYNTEVSILSGIAKHVGFPAAPEIDGVSTREMEEDLRKMGISRQPATLGNPSSLSQLPRHRPEAEEQFLEQTPWANPQHPIHSHMMDSGQHQVSGQMRPGSPFTPINLRRATNVNIPNGSASTIPAQPSSSLAPTPLTAEQRGSNPLKPSLGLTAEAIADAPSRPLVLADRGVRPEQIPPQGAKETDQTESNKMAFDPTPRQRIDLSGSEVNHAPHSMKSSPRQQVTQGSEQPVMPSSEPRIHGPFAAPHGLTAGVKAVNA